MKTWKVILVLCLVFIAGIAVGIVGTRIVVRNVIRRVVAHPELVREHIEIELVRKLKLSPEQRAKVHDVLKQSQERMRALREDTQPRFFGVVTNAELQISAILTPDQQRKFEKMREENHHIFPFSPASQR